jgi:hypothetical protein
LVTALASVRIGASAQFGATMNEVAVRPPWYRNLSLGACMLSLLLLATLPMTDQGPRLWLWAVLLLGLVVLWARVALRTCVRCDDRSVHSDRPLSKLTARASWDEVARFVHTDGVVKAELRNGEPLVVLDPSGDAAWVTDRLEAERERRQSGRSDVTSADASE